MHGSFYLCAIKCVLFDHTTYKEVKRMIWDIDAQHYPRLEEDIDCDTLIIGGGMAGMLCAKLLTQSGIRAVLVEGNRIGAGITRKTTAVVTAQHDTLYTQLMNDVGKKGAQDYLNANLDAVDALRALARSIACDWEERPSYIYSTTDKKKMLDEVHNLNSLGCDARFVRDIELPVQIKGAAMVPDMAQFHPLKFLHGIAKGLTIYEETAVLKINKNTAYTATNQIRAKRIIVATHFPFINRVGLFPAKMYQNRSYVVAVRGAQKLSGTYVDDSEGGLYFRDHGDLLIIGGSDHRTGTKSVAFSPIDSFIKAHYPDAKAAYTFANQDCVTLDSMPYVGSYSRLMPSLYVSTGFNLWGMTSSMVSATLLRDLLCEKENPYSETFSSTRSMLSSQLFINAGTSTLNMLLPTTKRCSHMGCALHYNKIEHSWDCACHGSRFDADGKLIDSPAMKDTKV